MPGLMCPDELYHHGIKGQKWGVRRYQNEDGTLTAAGRRRYRKAQNYAQKYYELTKQPVTEAKVRKDPSGYTDEELDRINKRGQLEATYNRLYPKPVPLGEKLLNQYKEQLTKDLIETANSRTKKILEKQIDKLLEKNGLIDATDKSDDNNNKKDKTKNQKSYKALTIKL